MAEEQVYITPDHRVPSTLRQAAALRLWQLAEKAAVTTHGLALHWFRPVRGWGEAAEEDAAKMLLPAPASGFYVSGHVFVRAPSGFSDGTAEEAAALRSISHEFAHHLEFRAGLASPPGVRCSRFAEAMEQGRVTDRLLLKLGDPVRAARWLRGADAGAARRQGQPDALSYVAVPARQAATPAAAADGSQDTVDVPRLWREHLARQGLA